MGGRISDLAVVESKPQHFFIATGAGGLWKTENHGTSWTHLFDDQPTSSIGDVTIHQENPNLVWVGTGEPQNREEREGCGRPRGFDQLARRRPRNVTARRTAAICIRASKSGAVRASAQVRVCARMCVFAVRGCACTSSWESGKPCCSRSWAQARTDRRTHTHTRQVNLMRG